MDILFVLVLAFLGGAVTVLGGFFYTFFRIGKRVMQFAMTASTGIVLSVIMLSVLPEALSLGGVGYTALGFVLGGIVMMVTGTLFPHTYGAERYEDKLYSILKTGSLVVYGMLLYNFPAGLLIGSGFAFSLKLGTAVLIAIVLQNIARGVAVSSPLSGMVMDKTKMLLVMMLAGVPTLAGALLAFPALAYSPPFLVSSGIAFSAGAMFFICADQLVPLVKSYSRRHEIAFALFIGVFAGVLIVGIG